MMCGESSTSTCTQTIAGYGALGSHTVRFMTIIRFNSAAVTGKVDSMRAMAFQLPDSNMMKVNSPEQG